MITVTPIYAILLTVIYVVLTVRVIMVRRSQKIAYGAGDDTDNIALVRAHANWAEFVPIALLLMLLAELQGAGAIWLHLTGLVLFVGRGLHAYGMGFNRKFFAGRVFGMAMTLGNLILLLTINLVMLF